MCDGDPDQDLVRQPSDEVEEGAQDVRDGGQHGHGPHGPHGSGAVRTLPSLAGRKVHMTRGLVE